MAGRSESKAVAVARAAVPLPDVPAGAVAVTVTAPVNIAVVKYWGKRDSSLILPINSSLSGTIDQRAMCSTTTIIASRDFKTNTFRLNDIDEDIKTNKRMVGVIKALGALAQDYKDPETGKVLISRSQWPSYGLRIVSNNNFPTAAGLASSASGFAAFAFCLGQLYGISDLGVLSSIARMGSGSACRSLYGGLVKWEMGVKKDGTDSIAVQVAPESHWADMRVLVLVVREGKKDTSSTNGMEGTVKTSDLVKYRMDSVVPQRMVDMERHIATKDFHNFADLTMKDSNSFHAVCLDTYPPIVYMSPTSHRIVRMVHTINKLVGRNVAAYTFDAGPNAVIYTLAPHMDKLIELFLHYFLPSGRPAESYLNDPLKLAAASRPSSSSSSSSSSTASPLAALPLSTLTGAVGAKIPELDKVASIIVTQLGPGPQILRRVNTLAPRASL